MAFTHTINVFVFYCREGQIDKAKGFSSCKWLLLLQHRTGVGARECVGWLEALIMTVMSEGKNVIIMSYNCSSPFQDIVAEWLRRWIANPLFFERESSNLSDVGDNFATLVVDRTIIAVNFG